MPPGRILMTARAILPKESQLVDSSQGGCRVHGPRQRPRRGQSLEGPGWIRSVWQRRPAIQGHQGARPQGRPAGRGHSPAGRGGGAVEL